MNLLKLLLTIIYIIATYGEISSGNGTEILKSVQIIFRHGARSPEWTYPNDPYQENTWPSGFGQLTYVGKVQLYNLGLYLRNRYSTFISKTIEPFEVYTVSSDVVRTIQSGYTTLAGFYANSTSIITSADEIIYQPAPVRTIDLKVDNLLTQSATCPRYDALLEEFVNDSELMQKLNMEKQDLFRYFNYHTGLNVANVEDFSRALDSLIVERYFGLELPEWTDRLFQDPDTTELGHFLFSILTYTDEMKRLKGGPMMKQLMTNFNNILSNELKFKKQEEISEEYKMYIFSAHDYPIASTLDLLGVFDGKRPVFASALILELYEKTAEKGTSIPVVKVFYKNETDSNATYALRLPFCGYECEYSTFLTAMEPYIPTDWTTECGLTKSDNWTEVDVFLVIVIILGTFGLLDLIIQLVQCIKSRGWCGTSRKYYESL